MYTTTRRTLAAALLLAAARIGSAQEVASPATGWSLRIPSGALVTTGAQRNYVHDGQASAIQISHPLLSAIGVTGTFAWARSSDVASAGRPKLDVFQSDIGLET